MELTTIELLRRVRRVVRSRAPETPRHEQLEALHELSDFVAALDSDPGVRDQASFQTLPAGFDSSTGC